MTVNELLNLSNNLNQLCTQAEEAMSHMSHEDPRYQDLVDQLKRLKSLTQEFNGISPQR